jgi:mycofactocin precursor
MTNDPQESTEPITVEDLVEEVSIDGMCGVY